MASSKITPSISSKGITDTSLQPTRYDPSMNAVFLCRAFGDAIPTAIEPNHSLPILLLDFLSPSSVFVRSQEFLFLSHTMRAYSSWSLLTTLTLSSLFCFCIDLVAAICYFPDGSLTPQDVPCLSDSQRQSNCCGPGYACLSNKICRLERSADEIAVKYTYRRGSCTDKIWRSSACPSFCILGSTRKSPLG